MNLQDPGLFHYLFLLFLLLLSGFFSGAEVALVSLSPAKVKSLAQQNKSGAASVQQLKHQPERLLITILIGNNVVNILIPVLSTIIFTSLFGNKILGIMTGLLTLAILIFGEILPKTIAQRYAVGFSLFSAPLIEFFSKILFPLIWLLERLTKMAAPTQWSQAIFSDSELIALAEIGEEEGHLDPEERERIENVLEFGDTTVDEVMTPRTEMEVVYDTATINETVSAFLNSSYSRLPVCHESKDKVTGVLMLKQVLLAQAGYGDDTQISSIPTQHPL
ncbi:MAG: CNNM domain-containing protein, partial [Thermodesulfobacteriota bacterium]